MLGLDCPTGEFRNCIIDVDYEDIPEKCKHLLIISDNDGKCGSDCFFATGKSKKRRNADKIFRGWTYPINDDKPINVGPYPGTGDHENYFRPGNNYAFKGVGNQVIEIPINDCEIISTKYKTVNDHKLWHTTSFNFLFAAKRAKSDYSSKLDYGVELINEGRSV